MPDMSAASRLYQHIRSIDAAHPGHPHHRGHGTTDTAIEAMKHGAFDYLVKPLDLQQLRRGGRPGRSRSRG